MSQSSDDGHVPRLAAFDLKASSHDDHQFESPPLHQEVRANRREFLRYRSLVRRNLPMSVFRPSWAQLESSSEVRVREVCRTCIGILDPEQLPLAQHGVRIVVEAGERSDLSDAFAHVPVELDSTLRLEIGGQQNVDVGLVPTEQYPLQRLSSGMPPFPA
jgi:hypothetical protein